MRSPESKRSKAVARIAATFLVLCVGCFVATKGTTILPVACSSSSSGGGVTQNPPPQTGRTYTTQFSGTENPISENSVWLNGQLNGLDWSDVAKQPGLAYGVESGNTGFDDSTALLDGNWGPDQMAQATVHTVNQNDNIFEEVELRLRSTLSAHRSTGYEINFRCSKTGNAYSQIVRWNGPLNDFTLLVGGNGAKFGVSEGDVVKATVIGNVITVYINGTQTLQTTDNTFSTGNPGIGFYLQGTSGTNKDYGFTSFTASDAL